MINSRIRNYNIWHRFYF